MTRIYQLQDIKVLRQSHCILSVPDLHIEQGQCIALLGDNGAGKSTLLDLLAFLTKPSHGRIVLKQQAIKQRLSTAQRRAIGYVNQHPFLLSGSITDNIRLALKLQNIPSNQHKQLIAQALQEVGLQHLATSNVSTLSGGELKRAAIARAIAYQPDILLLDEPFSHLDQHHVEQLETIIQHLAEQTDKTIIFSTHDRLRGTAIADSTINLVRGHVTKSPLINVFHGSMAEHYFDTGRLQIHTSNDNVLARHIAIDPNEIIISTDALVSSMRNHFVGRLTAITEEANTVRLTVDCGERFHATISPESLSELALSLGSQVHISFKSTVVTAF